MLYIIICWENVYEETLADFKKLGGRQLKYEWNLIRKERRVR